MLLMLDAPASALYTVATRGYPPRAWAPRSRWGRASSACRRASARRCASCTAPASTPTAARRAKARAAHGRPTRWRRRSRCPGWPRRGASSPCRSARQRLLGVLYAESPQDRALHLRRRGRAPGGRRAAVLDDLQRCRVAEPQDEAPPAAPRPPPSEPAAAGGPPLRGERQRVRRRRVPDQGRGRRHPLEAAARARGRARANSPTANCGSTRRCGCRTSATTSRRA